MNTNLRQALPPFCLPILKAAPKEQIEYDRECAALRADMDNKSFDFFGQRGQSMDMDQAIEYALRQDPS